MPGVFAPGVRAPGVFTPDVFLLMMSLAEERDGFSWQGSRRKKHQDANLHRRLTNESKVSELGSFET